MYKDKDKQREANRERQRRYKARQKALPEQGVTQGVTEMGIRILPSKRGKDIKVFADLPPDVQRTIELMSDDAEERAKRTAGAIHYQHLFPDRYYSTGIN